MSVSTLDSELRRLSVARDGGEPFRVADGWREGEECNHDFCCLCFCLKLHRYRFLPYAPRGDIILSSDEHV
jgi:hypothetical protein